MFAANLRAGIKFGYLGQLRVTNQQTAAVKWFNYSLMVHIPKPVIVLKNLALCVKSNGYLVYVHVI